MSSFSSSRCVRFAFFSAVKSAASAWRKSAVIKSSKRLSSHLEKITRINYRIEFPSIYYGLCLYTKVVGRIVPSPRSHMSGHSHRDQRVDLTHDTGHIPPRRIGRLRSRCLTVLHLMPGPAGQRGGSFLTIRERLLCPD